MTDSVMIAEKMRGIRPLTVRAAITIIVVVPIIVIYPFFQRYFVSGMTLGAVKQWRNAGRQTMGEKGRITFTTSEEFRNRGFAWAKEQALAYSHEDNLVGKWYEAALPDRQAFCMRDVAHHAKGAAALGLREHTRNMLLRFAQSIAESRQFCGFWEIDKDYRPCPVDYDPEVNVRIAPCLPEGLEWFRIENMSFLNGEIDVYWEKGSLSVTNRTGQAITVNGKTL